MKLKVELLLHLEKHGILERLSQLVMIKLKFCVSMERIGKASDSFVRPENEDLG